MLQEAIRRFMRGEVIPAEDQVEHDAYRLPDEMLAGLRAKAKSLGLWCFRTPEEYGGAGLV